MAGGETVLVTGGSGFIGGWVIATLLQRGYVVRTTVRDLAKEAAVRAAVATVTDPGNRLSFHQADLLADTGWDEAAAGCDYVLHVASPLGAAEPPDPDILIKPAREGARRAVAAAVKAGVKRIVLTSSVAATNAGGGGGDWTADENTWTDLSDRRVGAYARSKTLAERAAWDLLKELGGSTSMATVNPALVLGPPLSAGGADGSVQVLERLLTGRMPGLPNLGFNIVDVRDVADLQVRAMLSDEAAGQRFIAAGRFAWMSDMADIVRAGLDPAAAAKVPTRRVPNLAVRFASFFDKDLRFVTPMLGHKHDYTSKKAQDLLGWRPRPLEETVLDTARSLIAHGIA
jgi:nucleoside-diphosphate-sugar epimerase